MNKENQPSTTEAKADEPCIMGDQLIQLKASQLYQNVLSTLIYRQYPIGSNIDVEL